jgi:hypothetical protein
VKYYAATNVYASDVSVGGGNTWEVHVFDSRKSRDAFVESRTDLATRAIKKSEVTQYAANWDMHRNKPRRPEPFTGEYWGIVDEYLEGGPDGRPAGHLGYVDICHAGGWITGERVF